MTEFSLFIESLIMGLAIAAPVGPVSMICMRITLNQDMRMGISAGLGAATADGTYAVIACFSLTAFSMLLLNGESLLRLLACLYLMYLGLSFLFKKTNF
jgi:putative LysE/RhtB family amino acid efflux pump